MENKMQTIPQQSSNHKDRISMLPLDIKLHILSLLPFKEAIMTTFLSSAWTDKWIDLPNLNFNRAFCHQDLKIKEVNRWDWYFSKSDLSKSLKFLDFVDQTLMKKFKMHTYNVTSFTLYLPYLGSTPEISTPYLDRWLNLVVNDFQAEELIFFNTNTYQNPRYNFVINAYFSTLPLRQLQLYEVTLDPEMIEWLSRHCPLMEKLCFSYCDINDNIRVSNFPKLLGFVLRHQNYSSSNSLELELIDLPNLRFLEYKSFSCGKIQVDRACDNLEDLRLRGVNLTSNLPFSKLLTTLKLVNCKLDAEYVVISSNYLKNLSLKGCTYSTFVKVVRIDAPNLNCFNFSGSVLPPFFVLNHSGLEKAKFHWSRCLGNEWKDPPYEQFVKFLTKINPCKEFEIRTNWIDQAMIFEQEVQQTWNSPLSDVKHLKLGLDNRSWSNTRIIMDSYIDTILWLCPCPLTITISLFTFLYRIEKYHEQEFKVLKFKYYEGGHEGAERCKKCEFLPVRCWQHRLEEISIENHRADKGRQYTYDTRKKERTEDDNNIKAFFEKARGEKKIVVNLIS